MRRPAALGLAAVAVVAALVGPRVLAQQDGLVADEDAGLEFKHTTVEQGLPSDVVHAVTQDALGFVWVGTEDGLARLDGVEARTYAATGDSSALSGGLVQALAPGRGGDVWAGTNNGLSRYDAARDRFERVGGLPSDNVLEVAADGAGGAWVGTDAGAVRVLEDGRVEDGPRGAVRAVLPHDGAVWFGTDGGLVRLEDGQVETFRADSLGALSVSDVVASATGALLLGTRGEGLVSFDPETGRFAPVDLGEGLLARNVTDVYEDPSGTVWVATLGGGLRSVVLDGETPAVRVYQAAPEEAGSISDDQVSAVFEDRQGILWVGTYGGLDRVDRSRGAATRIRHDGQDPGSLASGDVRAVLEAADGTLWVGTDRSLDRSADGRTFAHLGVGGAVHALWETDGAVWAGSDGGLWRVDGDAPERVALPAAGASPAVTALFGDGEALWVGTETQGLLRYDLEGGAASRAWFEGAGVEVTALALGARGALWIGTDAGLCRLDVPTLSSQCFEAGPGPRSLASGTVQALWAQPNDALWVGTDAGLHRADVDDLEAGFRRYTADATDLPDDDVRAVVEDGDGFLWLSTGAGLVRFEPLTETFVQRAGVADADRALTRASGRAPDGRLYVGSRRGLLTFDPNQLAVVNGTPPQVAITGVEVSGQPVAPGGDVLEAAAPVADRITLGPSQGFLTIQYAALHFSSPLQNTFRYRLEGLRQSEWQDVGTTREATYESLPPGRYAFQVQAANADGVGFAEGARAAMASIEVVVRPPWWRTWWAIAGFVVVGAVALVRADQWQRARLLRQERERAERREAELRAEAAEAEQREARAEAAALQAENDRKAAELEGKREVEAANAKLAQANGQLEASLRDLQQTQTQLVQSEKLASLGQLTAGIAHEIKNPLNFVNNFADLSVDLAQELRQEIEEAGDRPAASVLEDVGDLIEDLQENARRIREHGQRADRIVRSMLLHSRGGSAERGRVEINRFVDEYANLAFHGARANDSDFQVEIVRAFADDAGEVEVVPQEFGRVLINLLTNAFHAVTERSALEGDGYRPQVTVATERRGSEVEVVIRDNGTGIPEAVKAKIFEPFFTTKPTGQGTGLGLSLAHDIVTQVHGGRMTVESAEGEGTAFHIAVPDRQPEG